MKRGKTTAANLPKPGTVFLMPLGDDRFGVCRVLRVNTEVERQEHGAEWILVAASPWIGTEAPDLSEPRLRELLKLTHHSWKSAPDLCWIDKPPPASYLAIGELAPTAADKRRKCFSSGGWYFAQSVLMQWRWDHDRESVLREDEEKAERKKQQLEAEVARSRASSRPGFKLASLRKYRKELIKEKASFFADWPIKTAQREACWQNLAQTIDALIALGKGGSVGDATDILRRCIERYNELDEGFICTIEREELCEILYEIGDLCGLDSSVDWVDEWRDW